MLNYVNLQITRIMCLFFSHVTAKCQSDPIVSSTSMETGDEGEKDIVAVASCSSSSDGTKGSQWDKKPDSAEHRAVTAVAAQTSATTTSTTTTFCGDAAALTTTTTSPSHSTAAAEAAWTARNGSR